MMDSLERLIGSIRCWRSAWVPLRRSAGVLAVCLAGFGAALAQPLPVSAGVAVTTKPLSLSVARTESQRRDHSSVSVDPLSEGGATVKRRPVWEVGIGGGVFSGFDYPASNDNNRRNILLPFFVYRGPQWRFGGGGLRAVAIEQPRIKLDLSIGGSLNASSEGNSVRSGMPKLDFLFEIGPQLEVSLYDRAMPSGGRVQLRFSSELRAVLSTDFRRVDGRGAVLEAGFGVNYRNVRNTGIDLLAALQSSLASERLQDYFYEVDPRFSTEARPAFDADGGYLKSGLFAGVALSPHKNLRLFMGVFTGWFEGARNEESPLFETDSSTGFAVGLAWTIRKSGRLVDVVELGSDS